ncbi:MAG: WD40 repeat domain-containing protein [Anaerolineales bacterium]
MTEIITAHSRPVLSMDFSQFEKSLLLISSGLDRKIAMTNLIALSSLDTLLHEGKGNPVRLAVPGKQELLVAGTTDSGITLWETQLSAGEENQVDLMLPAGNGNFYINPDGSYLALVSDEDVIEVHDLKSQAVVTIPLPTVVISETNAQGGSSLSEEIGQIDTLALNLDGSTLAGAYCSQRSRVREPGSSEVLDSCTDREILIWDVASGELSKSFSTEQATPIRSLAFKPGDENSLAAGYQDASIQFWEIEQERRSGLPLIGLGGPVTSLAFHVDGDVLASGSENKLIALWNLSPPQLIGDPFTGADGAVTGLAFSTDNSVLYSGTDQGTVLRWNIEEWKQLACQLAERNMTQAEWEQFFPNESYQEFGKTCDQYPLQPIQAGATTPPVVPTPTATGTPSPTP